MKNVKPWISSLFRLIKRTIMLLLGTLGLVVAVLIIRLNYFYSEATATITSVDYQGFRRCPISQVVYEADDGQKIDAYISAAESCEGFNNPRVGDSVQIVYASWLPYPNASLKSDFGENADSIDPFTAWYGAAMAAMLGLVLILSSGLLNFLLDFLFDLLYWIWDRRKR